MVVKPNTFTLGPETAPIAIGAPLALILAGISSAQPPLDLPEPASPPASTQQIAEWIKELDDNVFDVRTHATDSLILAGAPVVKPVALAASSGNLEVSMRAIYVLRELALSMDVAAQQQSQVALTEISTSGKRSVARLAREALDGFENLRQKQTVAQLKKLGATIAGYGQVGFQPVRPVEVVIGPGWEGTMKDLQRLAWLRGLSKVTFIGPQVTDSWIDTIKSLKELSYVAVRNARITDEALRTISQLQTVVYLDLMYTPVTDVGFDHLRGMKSLRLIRCFGTKVSKEAAARFQADLASVEVQHKLGAFLGVTCQQPPWPCEVIRVMPDSGAEAAGIKPRDIIVRYDKKPVASFEDLQKLIAINKVGDSVEVEVARGGILLNREITRQPPQPLGVEGESTSIGLKVTKALSPGAAAEAGVRAGDWIIAIDDDKVDSVDQLKKLYLRESPLRTGRLQVLRDVKVQKVTVTFGEWNE